MTSSKEWQKMLNGELYWAWDVLSTSFAMDTILSPDQNMNCEARIAETMNRILSLVSYLCG